MRASGCVCVCVSESAHRVARFGRNSDVDGVGIPQLDLLEPLHIVAEVLLGADQHDGGGRTVVIQLRDPRRSIIS